MLPPTPSPTAVSGIAGSPMDVEIVTTIALVLGAVTFVGLGVVFYRWLFRAVFRR